MDKGPSAKGRAAIAASDSIVDDQLDAAIGNVLLAADTQPRSMNVGDALCVRSNIDATSQVVPLTPEELEAQDERELALAECKAELAGAALHSEDNLSSDRDEDPPSPMRDDRFCAYERAGGFWHDQSVYGEVGPDVAIPKQFTYPGDLTHPIPHDRDKLVPFVNVWPDESCDLETWREAVDLHNAKLTNRRA
eukprot:4087142-Pleurochrysis_carterae.AAC.1